MPTTVTAKAPGKINLLLRVGPPGPEGYHELFTVFHAVDVWETVSATEAAEYSLTIEGSVPLGDVPLDQSNLVIASAKALAQASGHAGAAALHIHKSIPVGGGMGGGSADAAAALVALNELWGSRASAEDLHNIASGLGADVPFALLGGTALGRGHGGELTPLEAGLFHWVLVPLEHHLSTPAVYARLDEIRGVMTPTLPEELPGPMIEALSRGDGEGLAPFLENDLASAAVSLHPPVLTTVLDGEEVRALWAMVSGSGPTCVMLASNSSHQEELVTALGARGHHTLPTVSTPLGAHLV